MFQVLNGKATPATISFTLLPVDPTDEKAVEAVTASLPEGEREAAMGHLSEAGKNTDGGASKLAPAKPQAPASGAASHAKKWGIVKEAWDERVMVTAEHDRIEMVRGPWYEEKLVREAWTETIDHPAEYAIDKIKIGVMHGCDTCGFETQDDDVFGDHLASNGHIGWTRIDHPAEYAIDKIKIGVMHGCDTCGFETQDDDVFGDHLASNGHIGWTRPIYEEHKVLVKDAWTETINHPAEYQTVHHPAETKTVHYDAVYNKTMMSLVTIWPPTAISVGRGPYTRSTRFSLRTPGPRRSTILPSTRPCTILPRPKPFIMTRSTKRFITMLCMGGFKRSMHPWVVDWNGIVLSARDEMLVRMKAGLALLIKGKWSVK